MRQVRLGLIWILLVVILVFVLSNWDTVRVGMLGIDILEAPASVVILVSVALGMGLGFLVRALRGARRKV
ncbi:MAG: hypothetical protein OER77_00625 [Myxococcales bacterium]|nr:hypothetical protein [Myxococcales bacterium]